MLERQIQCDPSLLIEKIMKSDRPIIKQLNEKTNCFSVGHELLLPGLFCLLAGNKSPNSKLLYVF